MAIRSITVSFVPAAGGEHAYFGWKLNLIEGQQFKKAYQLPPTETLPVDDFRTLTTRALDDAFKHLRKVMRDATDG